MTTENTHAFRFKEEMRYNCMTSNRPKRQITVHYENGKYRFKPGIFAQRPIVKLGGARILHPSSSSVNDIMEMVNFVKNGRIVFEHSGYGVNLYANGRVIQRYGQVHNIWQCHDILYQRLGILVMGGPNSMRHHDPRDINHIIYPS